MSHFPHGNYEREKRGIERDGGRERQEGMGKERRRENRKDEMREGKSGRGGGEREKGR